METVPGSESTATSSPSIANLEAFKELFPGVIQDGALDAARLGEALGIEVSGLKDGKERFGLMWAGRREATEAMQSPSFATLQPDFEKSINFDSAQNVFVEGDNLEVLKLMQSSYNDKVKLIYIDPPYNTGNDFVYKDDFADQLQHYLEVTGQIDGDGNRLRANPEVDGRKHSNWLTMIYPRLALARNLLTQDGAIFVSIDDNEVHTLRLLMDEVFGPENFVACITWHKTYSTRNDAQEFSKSHEYLLVYKRNVWNRRLLPRAEKSNAMYRHDDGDGRGPYRTGDLTASRSGVATPRPLPNPVTGVEYLPPQGSGWRHSDSKLDELLADNRIYWGKDGKGAPQLKRYLSEVQDGTVPTTIWHYDDVGHTDKASKEVKELIGGGIFDYPKPTDLIRRVIQLGMGPDDIILDFFGGSGTTGHATMLANSEDNGRRKFILVTLPESTESNPTAVEAGYSKVSEITLARLNAAALKIGASQDIRVYCIGPSNFMQPSSGADDGAILFSESTLAAGANPRNVAAQMALKLGFPLEGSWLKVDGVNDSWVLGTALVCAGKDVSSDLLEIAKRHGLRTIAALEDAFASKDALKANLYFACKKANITFKTF
jgi:adenine-specific DNA-methyltransferase